MSALPHPAASARAGTTPAPASPATALRAELISALDHDLRTSLTTVLGALQTMARPDLAPADPELGALLSAALAQAQRMRRLLDELPEVCSPAEGRPIDPAELPLLIREAGGAGPGEGAGIAVEAAPGLSPLELSAPGLRRALAGILGPAGRGRAEVRVVVSEREGGCEFAISADDGEPLLVSHLSARLVTAMGGRVLPAGTTGSAAVRLEFPGARRPAAG